MDKFFLSKKNVEKQYSELARRIKFDKKNPKAQGNLKKLLVNHMKSVFQKYGSKKPRDMKPVEFIHKLNQISVSDSFKAFQEYTERKKRQKYHSGNLDDFERDRDSDLHGERPMRMPSRPRPPDRERGSNRGRDQGQPSMPGFAEPGGSSFAPFDQQDSGGMFRADGRVGRDIASERPNYPTTSGGGKDDLERAMMDRQSMYDMKAGFGNNFGYDSRMGPMGPDFNRSQRPPEINFRLDGTDSREDRNYHDQAGGGDFGNFGDFGGFDGGSNYGDLSMFDDSMGGGGGYGQQSQPPNNQMQQMMQQMMQNPMFMQMMMQQMMGQNGGGQGAPQGGAPGFDLSGPSLEELASQVDESGNLEHKMQRMKSDRQSLDHRSQQGGPGEFNAMRSPNTRVNPNQTGGDVNSMLMMQQYQDLMSGQNNWSNFHKGGVPDQNHTWEGPDYARQAEKIFTEDRELREKLAELKEEVAENNVEIQRFNPILYPSLKPRQLTKLIKRLNKRLTIPGLSDSSESESEHSNAELIELKRERDKLRQDREKLIEGVFALKSKLAARQNSASEQPLTPRPSHRISRPAAPDSDSDSESDAVLETPVFDPPLSPDTVSDRYDTSPSSPFSPDRLSSPSPSDSASSTDPIDSPVQQSKLIEVESDESVEVHEVEIDSQKVSDPDFYADYLCDLEQTYRNVVGISLDSYDIPKSRNNIHPKNNKFHFRVGGREQCLAIAKGEYSIDELVGYLQQGLEYAKVGLRISVDRRRHILIESDEKPFDLYLKPDSVLPLLGFIRSRYIGRRKYLSDREYDLEIDPSVYLYLDNITQQDPFAEIHLNEPPRGPIKKLFKEPISQLSELLIKFRYGDDTDELYDFDRPHKLKMKILTKT